MQGLISSDIERLVHSVRRRKWYYTAFVTLASIVVFCTVYALILPAITLTQTQSSTETNPTLSYSMYSNLNRTKRAYLEYSLPGEDRSETFGVTRQSVLYVYAYAGETICLGSDVTASRINENEEVNPSPTGVDILMIGPDGTKYTFDNDAESGLGFINTCAQEKAGANYTGIDNPDGYTPHEFKVRQTGLYEVRFHSYAGNPYRYATGIPHLRQGTNLDAAGVKVNGSDEPVIKNYNSDDWCNVGNTVGAFDITVVSDGTVKPGRTYADYLAFNMGGNTKNTPSFYGDFYIVTSDGYIYRSRFELDPFGFIFFANSRGVVDTDTGYTAYRSIRANGQGSGAQMLTDGMHYTVYTPQHEATDFDSTYMIFFEEPDPALQGILYQRAFAPGMATDIEFIGSKEGNITYVGNGGYFKFNVENAVSVTITVSFETYNENHGTAYEDIEIQANVTPGTNYIYWDGNDKNGDEVPVGWYKNGTIDIDVETHAGEIHFPFLDVENGDDITFERVNSIYRYDDGVLTDVTDSYDDSRYIVYYNNTILPDVSNSPANLQIANGQDRSDGIDSSGDRTLYFHNNTGDYTIIDVWTYSVSHAEMEISTDLIVEDLDGYFTVNLTGFVFFDKDNSSYYELSGGDFSLSDVDVSLDYYYCGTRWTVEHDPDDPDTIIGLLPVPHTLLGEDAQGNPYEKIDYYYHNYEVRLGEDGEYYLYKYEYTDYLHENEPTPATVRDEDGVEHPITVDIYTETADVELDDGTVETVTKYLVWIPVHRETTTDTIGNYYFSGLLVNEDMYDPPVDHPEYGEIVVSVKNPNPDLYILTTGDVCTGDFEGVNGTDLEHGSQTVQLDVLESKIIEKRAADPDLRNFFFSMSDVGYYYETYEPPLTVVKHWGTTDVSDNIARIVFTLEAYSEQDGVVTVYDTREVTLSYFRWFDTLTDLPAAVVVDGERIPLSYRISAESFVKYENEAYSKYVYTYYWDADPPYCVITAQLTDANGKPTQNSVPEYITEEQFPFETYIGELENLYTGDRITVENWSNDTTYITLTKYGAYDDVTKLPLATFKLQKLVTNETTGTSSFVDVVTDMGVYTVTTDVNGVAIFRGLTEGTYRIVETVAPEYYNLLDDPIVFTVSKTDGPGGNSGVTGSYEESYAVSIYDHLVEQPFSLIQKLDQYGDAISGAEFTVYKADENYNYDPATDAVILGYNDENEPIPAVVEIGNDGTASLMVTLPDGSRRSIYISELLTMLEGSDRFVLAETKVPDGYRKVGDAHMRITGSGLSSFLICDNPYESGVWVEPMVTVYAPETLQVADMDYIDNISSASYVNVQTGEIAYIDYTSSGNITYKGTLFGVIMKRNQAEPEQGNMNALTFEGWVPVYGNAVEGYHTVSDMLSEGTLENVIYAVKEYGAEYTFGENSEGTLLYTHIENFPGRTDRYLTYMLENGMSSVYRDDVDPPYYSDPQYAVLYYYSTSPTVEGISADNTVRVTSHGLFNQAKKFTTHFSTNILIPDVNNAVYVQKADVDDNLVDNAVFGMYDAVSQSSGEGYYVGYDESGAPVYIKLSEDEGMTAEIYRGTFDAEGFFEPNEDSVITGTYTFETRGFEQIAGLTPDEVFAVEGRPDLLPDVADNAGDITVTDASGNVYTIHPAYNADYSEDPPDDPRGKPLLGITHDTCTMVNEDGTAHFRNLKQGKYYVRELYTPQGFALNYTNIEVYVGYEEVYANAGSADDGVKVGNGAGYVVSTLNQFASIGDISETLSYIYAALQIDTLEGSEDGFADLTGHSSWDYALPDSQNVKNPMLSGLSTTNVLADAARLYLMYNGAANEITDATARTLFDYAVNYNGVENPERDLIESLMLWTQTGWSDLAIFQDRNAAFESDLNDPTVTYTDISEIDGLPYNLSLLFSGSTFIRVTDETEIDLKLRKINSATNGYLNGAKFVLYKTENDENIYLTKNGDGEFVWRALNDGEEEYELSFTSGEDGEYGEIYFGDFDNGKYYLKETEAPVGFYPEAHVIEITVARGTVTAMKDNGAEMNISSVELSDDGKWVYTVVVPNDMGYKLPETGGSGTLLYTVGGCGLMLLASVVYGYIYIKKRERRKG